GRSEEECAFLVQSEISPWGLCLSSARFFHQHVPYLLPGCEPSYQALVLKFWGRRAETGSLDGEARSGSLFLRCIARKACGDIDVDALGDDDWVYSSSSGSALRGHKLRAVLVFLGRPRPLSHD